jgi:subtilase family serine protease
VSGPSTGGSGGTISVTDTTTNQGGSGSGAFVTGFYLSTNYSLEPHDVRLGERSIPSLGAAVSNTAATNLTIPATTLPGMYYIIANADDGNAVGEPVENNNMRVTTTQFKVGADLMVVSIGTPLTGGAGGTISLTDNLRNVGGARSVPSEAVFYLSANTTLDGLDVEIARRGIPALDPGVSSATTTVASIPADTQIGSYFVIEVVDPLDVVDEAVENNNSYRGNAVKIGPDLTVISLSAPATVVAGSSITVTDMTKNSGGGAVGASTTAFYLSTNVTLEPGDIAVGSRAVPGLAAGASHSFSGPITIPTTVPAGTYYLIANANEGVTVAETSTTNNVFRYVIRVTQP